LGFMYRYYSPHPGGKCVPDCVKRAITKATGLDYTIVARQLNRYKKVTGAKHFNSNNNWKPYVEKELRATKLSFPAVEGLPRMNGHRFTQKYNKGVYILRMAGHICCCVDGVIYDTWDCSEKCVYLAYKVPPIIKYYVGEYDKNGRKV